MSSRVENGAQVPIRPTIRMLRVGPLTTIQDEGRWGALGWGIAASGPMDRVGFAQAGLALGAAGSAGIEFTAAGLVIRVEASAVRASFAGGEFSLRVKGRKRQWPWHGQLRPGDDVEVTPGSAGNYGYVRFEREVDVPVVLGSRATNTIAHFGGFEGRALRAGDVVHLGQAGATVSQAKPPDAALGPIRIVWGLHANLFSGALRQRFVGEPFRISARLDRMGVRLDAPEAMFGGAANLSLVSDAIVPGDIQILGDGTPIVLMRDHQPTGGYPRIATVASADLDRFAQLRPGAEVRFAPMTPAHARSLLR